MKKQPTKSVTASKSGLFIAGCLIALLGFIAGSRQQQIIAAIGPVFGISYSAEQLDTTSLQDVFHTLKNKYDGSLDTNKLLEGAKKGLVAAAGDEYTVYFDPKEAEDFNKLLQGDVGAGVGVEIGERNNQATVVRVLPNNPAERAGLKVGDQITTINGKDCIGWDVDRVAAAVRGDAGTTVKIKVLRDGQPVEVSITREKINNPSVQSKIEDNIGILEISRFDSNTSELAEKAVADFVNKKVKAVVLDVRNDGGGELSAAVDVAGLWLKNGVVAVEKKDGKVTNEYRTSGNPVLAGMPTIVLVNQGSASASEIVASALHDNNAAKLLGEKTFGKGSVQEPIPMNNEGLLKVTIARWYTPKGVNVSKQGITPDISVAMTKDDINAGRDPQMAAALEQLR